MASILEAFGVVFDFETEEAKKKTDDLTKATDEFEKKANSAELSSQKLGGSLLKMGIQAAGLVTALFSVGAVMGGIANAVNYADSVGEAAEALGVATEDLSAWSDAAKLSGGSAEGLQQSVKALSKDLYQFAETGKSRAEPFLKSLGIAMTDASGKARDVFDVLPDIAQAMEGMSKQEAVGFGQKLGLDQGTIMLLQQGKTGLDELIKRQKELGGVTKEDAETAAKFNDALDDTAHSFRTVYMGVATALLPAFTWVLEKVQALTKWSRDHKVFFMAMFSAIGTAVTLYYLPAMYKAASATIAATWPFLLIGAAIVAASVALALIVEDIYAFLTGGESLIGQLTQKWPIIGKIVEGIRDGFIWLFQAAEKVITFFSSMWNDPRRALEDFKAVLGQLWNDFIASVPGLRTVLDTVVAIFNTAIGGIKKTIEAVTSSITKARDVLTPKLAPKGFDSFNANTSVGNVPEAARKYREKWLQEEAAKKLQMTQAQTPMISQMQGSSIVNSNANQSIASNTTNNNTITINTGADPREVEKVFNDVLESKTKTAIQQIDDGVSH